MNWGQLITFSTVYEPILDRKFPYITNPSKDYMKGLLSKKYPDYTIHEFNADVCFASFEDNLGNKIRDI